MKQYDKDQEDNFNTDNFQEESIAYQEEDDGGDAFDFLPADPKRLKRLRKVKQMLDKHFERKRLRRELDNDDWWEE